ncbi:FadR/GntR family transcriptional regulator [Roseibium salinum]|uniref:FadR/GntR family transcriptional regulator n=1 Tax=Roseibium salinum TaxID=1604349 RepID=A0ABT3R328_9HYPH|nr:FadR/GntR family transcriptional regulator [Roseibium sp. DSM 29163]MCX2723584.1 FadR/GntR family transcriptional regulator [Roseibium sp. DSM 29163]
MTEFREVRREALLPDQIAADILAKITEGHFRPGDVLPTEHCLADVFGVSRNVVREAIARLRSDGAIESRQGRGAIVKPLTERETFRIEMQALNKPGNLADLYELRGLLEITAAGLAAERRSGRDLDTMYAAIAAMSGKCKFDETRMEADAAFHRALAKATRNSYLGTIVCYMSSRLKHTLRATPGAYQKGDRLDLTIREHREILDAVEDRDATAARTAMAAHIQAAAERLNVPVKAKRR